MTIPPWKILAENFEEKEEVERTADCTMRYLEWLIEKRAFKEVRTILRDTETLMDEAIDVLQDAAE